MSKHVNEWWESVNHLTKDNLKEQFSIKKSEFTNPKEVSKFFIETGLVSSMEASKKKGEKLKFGMRALRMLLGIAPEVVDDNQQIRGAITTHLPTHPDQVGLTQKDIILIKGIYNGFMVDPFVNSDLPGSHRPTLLPYPPQVPQEEDSRFSLQPRQLKRERDGKKSSDGEESSDGEDGEESSDGEESRKYTRKGEKPELTQHELIGVLNEWREEIPQEDGLNDYSQGVVDSIDAVDSIESPGHNLSELLQYYSSEEYTIESIQAEIAKSQEETPTEIQDSLDTGTSRSDVQEDAPYEQLSLNAGILKNELDALKSQASPSAPMEGVSVPPDASYDDSVVMSEPTALQTKVRALAVATASAIKNKDVDLNGELSPPNYNDVADVINAIVMPDIPIRRSSDSASAEFASARSPSPSTTFASAHSPPFASAQTFPPFASAQTFPPFASASAFPPSPPPSDSGSEPADVSEERAILDLFDGICRVLEHPLTSSSVKGILSLGWKLTKLIARTGWTVTKAAYRDRNVRMALVFLVLVARHKSPILKEIIDAIGSGILKATGHTLNYLIGFDLERTKLWAHGLIESVYDDILARITGAIVDPIKDLLISQQDNLKELLKDFAAEVKAMVEAGATVAAVGAVRDNLLNRMFGGVVQGAASAVGQGGARMVMSGVLDGIARAAGSGNLLTNLGGKRTNRTRKNKSKPKKNYRKTQHNKNKKKITRRKRKQNKRQPKKRTRRIK